jgi:hypothetical protein
VIPVVLRISSEKASQKEREAGALPFHPDVADALLAAGWSVRARGAARVLLAPPDGSELPDNGVVLLRAELPGKTDMWRLANAIDARGEATWQGRAWTWPAQYVRALDIYRPVTPFVFWIGGQRCPWRARLNWKAGRPFYELRSPGVVEGAAAWRASFAE